MIAEPETQWTVYQTPMSPSSGAAFSNLFFPVNNTSMATAARTLHLVIQVLICAFNVLTAAALGLLLLVVILRNADLSSTDSEVDEDIDDSTFTALGVSIAIFAVAGVAFAAAVWIRSNCVTAFNLAYLIIVTTTSAAYLSPSINGLFLFVLPPIFCSALCVGYLSVLRSERTAVEDTQGDPSREELPEAENDQDSGGSTAYQDERLLSPAQ